MRQRHGLAFGFPRRFRHKPIRVFVGRDQSVCHGGINQASAGIQPGLILGGHEGDGKVSGTVNKRRLEDEIVNGLEMGNFQIAGDHQRQRGRLDAAQRENIGAPVRASLDGQGASSVDACQPVGAASGASGVAQGRVAGVVREICQRLFDREIIQRGQPDTFNVSRVAEVFQHFIHEELAFAVGIARIDHGIGFPQQRADDVKLCGGVLFDLVFPLGRNDGQVFAPPVGVFGLVIPWPCLFEHVPEAPRHHIVATEDAAFGFFLIAKASGNGPAKRRFFGNKQSHLISSCGAWPRFSVQ